MGQLEQFLSDIAPNGDWQPIIDYIEQNYISKEKIKKILKEYGEKEIDYAPEFYQKIRISLEE